MLLLEPERLVDGSGCHAGRAVLVADGVVEATGAPEELASRAGERHSLAGTLLPGALDLQVNGAGGHGVETGEHAAPLSAGTPGVLHGNRTYLMQDEDGQILHTHSVSAGLDYPGVGPEHSWLKDIGRVNYVAANDDEALAAFHRWTRMEGIMPALETSHAIAGALELASSMESDQHIVVCLSGRGDKDTHTVASALGVEIG